MATHIGMDGIAHYANPLGMIILPDVFIDPIGIRQREFIGARDFANHFGVFGQAFDGARRIIIGDGIGRHQDYLSVVCVGSLHDLLEILAEIIYFEMGGIIHPKHGDDKIGFVREHIGLHALETVRRGVSTDPSVDHFQLCVGIELKKRLSEGLGPSASATRMIILSGNTVAKADDFNRLPAFEGLNNFQG